MSDVTFDDPAGRTRFAWARTLLVVFVVSLFVERLFFAGTLWSLPVIALPVATVAVLTLVRSRGLRQDPPAAATDLPAAVFLCVAFIGLFALFGVARF